MGAHTSFKQCLNIYVNTRAYSLIYIFYRDRGPIAYFAVFDVYYVSQNLGAKSNYKHSVNSYINNKYYVLIYIFYVHYGDIEYYSIYDMLKVPNYVSLAILLLILL